MVASLVSIRMALSHRLRVNLFRKTHCRRSSSMFYLSMQLHTSLASFVFVIHGQFGISDESERFPVNHAVKFDANAFKANVINRG